MDLPRPAALADLEPFAVEVHARDRVALVRPRGELELATVEALRSTLDAAIAEILDGGDAGARVVLDLRGLSFIDSTGLHLLVALAERAERDGFTLSLLAPAAPADRAIRLCGLDELLPFADPSEAFDDSQ